MGQSTKMTGHSSGDGDGQGGLGQGDEDLTTTLSPTAASLPLAHQAGHFNPKDPHAASSATYQRLPTRHRALNPGRRRPRAYRASRPRPQEGRRFLGLGMGRRTARSSLRQTMILWTLSCLRSMVRRASPDSGTVSCSSPHRISA